MNVAARIERLAKEHALPIVLSDTTRRALAATPVLRALGSIPIRGRIDPVACWALDGDDPGTVDSTR